MEEQSEEFWVVCPRCERPNKVESEVCHACGYDKFTKNEALKGPNEGIWFVCSMCEKPNQAGAAICHACGYHHHTGESGEDYQARLTRAVSVDDPDFNPFAAPGAELDSDSQARDSRDGSDSGLYLGLAISLAVATLVLTLFAPGLGGVFAVVSVILSSLHAARNDKQSVAGQPVTAANHLGRSILGCMLYFLVMLIIVVAIGTALFAVCMFTSPTGVIPTAAALALGGAGGLFILYTIVGAILRGLRNN